MREASVNNETVEADLKSDVSSLVVPAYNQGFACSILQTLPRITGN
jgi:hypothetical protein